MRPKVELVLTCVDFSDFLEITLPENKDLFDNVIVVTSLEDGETEKLCNQYQVNCIKTSIFTDNNASFNMGGGRNEGLKNLKFNEWVVIADTDIIFPKNLHEIIPWEFMNKEILYGGSRRFIWTYQDYLDLKNGVKKEKDFESREGFGCGFLQICNMKSNVFKRHSEFYPSFFSAENVDIHFLKLFGPVTSVGKLDLTVNHLGYHGTFHRGRENSELPELKNKKFKDMPNLSQHTKFKL